MAINYILYCTKDTLIVHHIGPESVVFLRTYLVIPCVLAFFYLSNRLSALFGIRNFFAAVVGGFVLFQLLFAFVLYPHLESWKFKEFDFEALQLITYWPLTLYYLWAEIWVVFVLGVITWQAINAVNTVETAKKSYHFLQLFSNLVIFCTSQLILFVNFANDWFFSLKVKALLMLGLGLLSLYGVYILLPPNAHSKKDKKSFALIPFLRLLVKNKQSGALFLMVLFYTFSNTFSETLNRFYIKQYAVDILSYNNVMAYQSSCMSILTISFIGLGAYFTRKNLSHLSLLLTPLFVFLSTCTFGLFFAFFPQFPLGMMTLSVLQIAVIKSSKYGLIDPVKEFCYLEMSGEMKMYGKSFIDGVSNRSGKALGNLLQQGVFILFGGISFSLPMLLVILGLIALAWLKNTKTLISTTSEQVA